MEEEKGMTDTSVASRYIRSVGGTHHEAKVPVFGCNQKRTGCRGAIGVPYSTLYSLDCDKE
jgi:hypothetical protein